MHHSQACAIVHGRVDRGRGKEHLLYRTAVRCEGRSKKMGQPREQALSQTDRRTDGVAMNARQRQDLVHSIYVGFNHTYVFHRIMGLIHP